MKNEITHKNSLISLFAPLDPLNRLTSQHNIDQNNSSLLLEEIMDEKEENEKMKYTSYDRTWSSVNTKLKSGDNSVDASFTDHSHQNTTKHKETISDQLRKVRELKHSQFLNNKQSLEKTTEPDKIKIGAWEIHNRGFASKVMLRVGYGGKGLGKLENGIIDPIEIPVKYGRGGIGVDEEISNMPKKTVTIERDLQKLLSVEETLNSRHPTVNNKVHHWPRGTTLIAGDSILYGVEENRLKNKKAKVRVFPGARVDDFYDYLTPLVKKRPTNIILHVGSNDAPHTSAEQILNEILTLKACITSILPTVKIFISCPTVRRDNSKANSVLRELDNKLKSLTKDIVINDNVDDSCLGKKGLHLNPKGSGRLAINYISLMRRL